jgi:CRP-like cAMP-binding protein
LLQEDVHDFLHKTQNTRDFQEETDKFFDLISPRLKVSVQQKIFESNLRKNPII